MRTWSLEETIIRAQSAVAVGVQGVIDVFTHRPAYSNDHPIPGCPSASDCRGFGCAGDCSEAMEAPAYDDDPMVSDSYLRYNEVESGHDMGARLAAEMFPQYTKSNLAAGARAAGSSPSEVSGHSPRPPSEGCPDPSRGNRLASVRGEGSPADSGIRTSPAGEQPELDWHGWSVPAICEVLAEHRFIVDKFQCSCDGRGLDSSYEWRSHVAPSIASRLACDPARAIAALHNHKPQ